ncbi:unnamed protein product [Lampetra planeri]
MKRRRNGHHCDRQPLVVFPALLPTPPPPPRVAIASSLPAGASSWCARHLGGRDLLFSSSANTALQHATQLKLKLLLVIVVVVSDRGPKLSERAAVTVASAAAAASVSRRRPPFRSGPELSGSP